MKKRWLQIASFPGHRIAAVFSRLAPLFPHAVAAPSVIHTGFTNANAMLHVANCVGNAGKIDRGEAYKFYAEGVTPSVARLYQAINAERVAVAAALGASVPTLEDWFDRVYGVRGADLTERVGCSPPTAMGRIRRRERRSRSTTSISRRTCRSV